MDKTKVLPREQDDAALRQKDWSEYLSSGNISGDIATDDFMELIEDLPL